MIDLNRTIEYNIVDKFKMLSLQATNINNTKDIISLILIDDMIVWAGDLQDASKKEALLVMLKNKLLTCYKNKLKLCRYNGGEELMYSNVNTAQDRYEWLKVNTDYLSPKLCKDLKVLGETSAYDDCLMLVPFGQVTGYNPCDVIIELTLGEVIE